MATRWLAGVAVLVGLLAGGADVVAAEQVPPCACLENGGHPGPGDYLCDVTQCYRDCVAELCPDTPNCTLECSRRCSCNSAPEGCPTHEDPGPTPTALGRACLGDGNGDDVVTIDELVGAVSHALNGCP